MLVDEGGGAVIGLPAAGGVAGRSNEADVHLVHESISRRHAMFGVEEGVLWVEDLGSRNGTFVNGEPTQGRVALRAGDEIQLGHLQFRLEAGVAAPAARPVYPKVVRATQAIPSAVLAEASRGVVRAPGQAAPAVPAGSTAAGAGWGLPVAAFAVGLLLGVCLLVLWVRM